MLNFDSFLFFLFSLLGLFSAFLVISLKNAVHSVLFLVLTFFNFSCLLLLLGAEFFSFLLIIVYVGAIAVLFLFVIMMLNIKLDTTLSHFYSLFPLVIVILIVLCNKFLAFTDVSDLLRFCVYNLDWIPWFQEKESKSNIFVIGTVLYSEFCFLFIIAGFVLLTAMIGAIVLTMHAKANSKSQIIELQLIRNQKDSLKFIQLRK
uniref:NADH-ubiquinone oxidoreductase chain 6 n=1 Tax=Montagnia macrospora TaxID=2662032 RepID=A0A343UXS5_9FLOR|nr:NADH dehydrogenase subunit 6 [Montagnia macrospora]AVK39482.1 NADH dehydrogenase subunit 6 [Montagnia macrospora]